jgi:hypothetical protein
MFLILDKDNTITYNKQAIGMLMIINLANDINAFIYYSL